MFLGRGLYNDGMTITVSTDGSALGNPNGPMGWAWADHETGKAHTPGHDHDGDCDAGGATNGTNQIGELCAVLEALRAHPGPESLLIETDSKYAINCSTTWVHGWKKNGWKNSQKKPVKNAPLIKAIDAEISRREGSVKFRWVKGHAGNAGNEKVDDLAHTYSGDARSGVKDGYLPLEGWRSLLASAYAKGVDIPPDAQMLLDGAISPEQYHLGRGTTTSDDASNTATSADVADAADAADAGSHGSASTPRLERMLTEAEGVPDIVLAPESSSASLPPSASLPSSEPLPASSASTPDSPAPTASASTTSANAPTTRTPQSNATPRRERAATGLTVSGMLHFSPPPSTSPTYDGRPRRITGTVTIHGEVDGNGDIRIDDAPFTVLP